MTNPVFTPDSILFLTFIALAIAFLILGEMIEARRARAVPVRISTRPAARLRALPKAARAAWRARRSEAAAAIRSLAVD